MPKTGTLLDDKERRDFTEWLSACVKARGLSRLELGRRLGYDDRGNALKPARRYLRGGAIPTERIARDLSRALEVPQLEMLVRAGHLDAVLPAIEHLAQLEKPWAMELAFDLIFALFPPADASGKPLSSLRDGVQRAKGAIVDAAGRIRSGSRSMEANEVNLLSAFRFLDGFIVRWAQKHRTLRNRYLGSANKALHDPILSPYRRRTIAASYLHDWAIKTDSETAQVRLGAAVLVNRLTSKQSRRRDAQ